MSCRRLSRLVELLAREQGDELTRRRERAESGGSALVNSGVGSGIRDRVESAVESKRRVQSTAATMPSPLVSVRAE